MKNIFTVLLGLLIITPCFSYGGLIPHDFGEKKARGAGRSCFEVALRKVKQKAVKEKVEIDIMSLDVTSAFASAYSLSQTWQVDIVDSTGYPTGKSISVSTYSSTRVSCR